MIFISLETDPFQETFNAKSAARQNNRNSAPARRPLRGLEIKEDTNAIIKVISSTGNEISLIDGGAKEGRTKNYTNFILQSVQEARMEKHQIVETFGESYIFFFGESPRFLDVQAVLLDSNDFNWYAEFMANYDQFLRGTRSVEIGARTYLFYEDNIVEGYMLNAQAVKTSDTPLMVRLGFRMYITQSNNISFVGDTNFPIRGINLPKGISSVNEFATNQAALNASLAIALQQGGFGGGAEVVKALRQGAEQVSGVNGPATNAIFQNAAEAFATSDQVRTLPLRSLITDNLDEYIGGYPEGVRDLGEIDNVVDGGEIDDTEPADEKEEAKSFFTQLLDSLKKMGSDVKDQLTFEKLGLKPRFTPNGISIGNGATPGGASFGPNVSNATGGIGGGFGFSGRASPGGGIGFTKSFNPLSSLASSVSSDAKQINLTDQLNFSSFKDILNENFSKSFGPTSNFRGGVRVVGGVSSGTGIGGGVSGGHIFTSNFTKTPTTGPGISPGTGNGANVNVGGTPSPFAFISAKGRLCGKEIFNYEKSTFGQDE